MEPGQPEPQASQKGLIASILFATLVVSGSLVFLGIQMNNSKTAADTQAQMAALLAQQNKPQTNENIVPVTAKYQELVDNDAVMGDQNAKLTLVEFSDYQCPFCLRHFTQTFPQLKSNYIDTGKLKYVFRDFPLPFHPEAQSAAIGAECARQQGGDGVYFQMGQKIFSGQEKMYDQSASDYQKTLKGFASELGLNASKFASCVVDPSVKAEVEADSKAGSGYGVEGTPSFVLTDGTTSTLIKGAQPFSVFQEQINKLLK